MREQQIARLERAVVVATEVVLRKLRFGRGRAEEVGDGRLIRERLNRADGNRRVGRQHEAIEYKRIAACADNARIYANNRAGWNGQFLLQK